MSPRELKNQEHIHLCHQGNLRMDKFRLFPLEKLLLHCISIIEDVRKKQFFQQQSTSINLCCASRFAKEQKEDYLCCNQDQENK